MTNARSPAERADQLLYVAWLKVKATDLFARHEEEVAWALICLADVIERDDEGLVTWL